jgi:hypothetical protein
MTHQASVPFGSEVRGLQRPNSTPSCCKRSPLSNANVLERVGIRYVKPGTQAVAAVVANRAHLILTSTGDFALKGARII